MKDTAKKTPGRGGDFDTRPNPFSVRGGNEAPSLAEHPNLGLALDKVIQAGCAIIIGATRDGGCICLTVLDGDTRHRSYSKDYNELEAAIEALRYTYTEP